MNCLFFIASEFAKNDVYLVESNKNNDAKMSCLTSILFFVFKTLKYDSLTSLK